MSVKHIRFGVEVELDRMRPQQAREIVRDYFESGFDPLGRKWSVVRDGSVPTGFELVTPPIHYADLPTLRDLFRRLRGGGATPSPRCGTHVHVDASLLGAEQICHLLNVYVAQGLSLREMMRLSLDRRIYYALPIDGFVRQLQGHSFESHDDLLSSWYRWAGGGAGSSSKMHPSRYHEINLHSLAVQGTIEFRGLAASRSAMHLTSCVTLILAVTSHALRCSMRACPLLERLPPEQLLLQLGLDRQEFRIARRALLESTIDPNAQILRDGPSRLEVLTRDGHSLEGGSCRAVVGEMVEIGFFDTKAGQSVIQSVRNHWKKQPLPRSTSGGAAVAILQEAWRMGIAQIALDGALLRRESQLTELPS